MPKKISVETVSDDLANLEGKVDDLAGTVDTIQSDVSYVKDRIDKMPTKADLEEMFERSFAFATLKAEHERIKQIIREHHNIEI